MDSAATRSPGRRATRRAEVEAALLEVGRRHLAEHGAAALSIRAVARDLDLAPSALFRYVSGRDELLTRLIVAAYSSLADTVQKAHDRVPRDQLAARWRALAYAVRDWARANPHEWALLFGSPVPHYQAPGEQTNEPGTRVPGLLVAIGADAQAAGLRTPEPFPGAPDLAGPATDHLHRESGELPVEVLSPVAYATGITVWVLLVGAVSTEVFEQLGPNADPDPLFDYVVRVGQTLLFGPDAEET